jgi:hypothetical protein
VVIVTLVICTTIVVNRWITRHQPARPIATADPAAVLAERDYAHRLSVIRLGPPLELH